MLSLTYWINLKLKQNKNSDKIILFFSVFYQYY